MFPEDFAKSWVLRLTEPGDYVLDPFFGRGTTPFQSLLLGRKALATDTNDVAFCLTAAKTSAPKLPKLLSRIDELEESYDGRKVAREARDHHEFFRLAYTRDVLNRLLFLRKTLDWKENKTDRMVAALVLGALHGEVLLRQKITRHKLIKCVIVML